MNSPIQFVRTGDGVSIAYCQHGAGPPLVYVRGWISHLERMWALKDFRPFIEALASRFQVTRYDCRGNGLSDQDVPAPTIDDLVLDLDAVVEKAGARDVILYGSAFGSLIALAFAAKHPDAVSRLIVENGYARGSQLGTREQMNAVISMLRAMPRPATHMLGIMSSPDSRGANPETAFRSISDKAAVDLYTLAYEVDIEDRLPLIKAPTLVMHSTRSPTFPFAMGRRLAAGIEGARFVGIESSTLNPYEGDATPVLKAISDFLGVDVASAYSAPAGVRSQPVTILFTDMEGSTAMTSRKGDAAAQELLRAHDALIRDCLKKHSGREIKHLGDGIMATFRSASEALQCAMDIQDGFAARNSEAGSEPINVRVALNAGEPVSEGSDIYGTSVQLAARLVEKASPGQVLVANVVRELVAGKGFRFQPRGTESLRGIDEAVGVYELTWR
jgi:class 3 adenylate cyclase/pimeloyl-ACP methyl ester carboxylesterase